LLSPKIIMFGNEGLSLLFYVYPIPLSPSSKSLSGPFLFCYSFSFRQHLGSLVKKSILLLCLRFHLHGFFCFLDFKMLTKEEKFQHTQLDFWKIAKKFVFWMIVFQVKNLSWNLTFLFWVEQFQKTPKIFCSLKTICWLYKTNLK
jgi:hypothetical protein